MKKIHCRYLLPIAIAATGFLGFLPFGAKASTQYFTTNVANGGTYSWDAANWGTASTGTFANTWTNKNFAEFVGFGTNSYTITVNQAETNIGIFQDGTGNLTISDAGNGTGSLNISNLVQGFLGLGGGATIINCPITGKGGIAPEYGGPFYINGTNTYNGQTQLGDSGNTLVYFDNNSAFSTNVISLNRTGVANFSTLLGYGGSALTLTNNFTNNIASTGSGTALNFADASNTPVTCLGTWTLGSGNVNLRSAGGVTAPLTLSGNISGSGTLYFSVNPANDGPGGADTEGVIILSATNPFTGVVEVTGMTNSFGSTTYGGNTNATLVLGVAGAIAKAKSVVLAGGGILNGNGFNVTNSGTLVVSNSSSLYTNTIYLGGGNMYFANSSAAGWSNVLDLADFSGIGSTYGGTQFRVGTSGSGLTGAQLALIEFDNNPTTLGTAAIDPNGFVYNSATAPAPTFSVTAVNSSISQPNSYGNPTSTTITITRGGSLASSITVSYTLSGTAFGAAAGSGYPAYPATATASSTSGTAVFAANQMSSNITITAVSDSIPRPTTTLTLTLSPGAGYSVVSPSSAAVNVLNTAPDEVFAWAGAAPSMYKAFSNDYTAITLTRWGDTNAAAFPVNSFNYSGTAVEGTDFAGTMGTPPSVTINPGDLSDTVYFSPLINGQIPVDTNGLPYTGNKTFTVNVAAGTGYTGSTNSATFTIIDNQNPPATVLFSDPLTNSTDPNIWSTNAASSDMVTGTPVDFYTDFGYDLNADFRDQDGVPIPFPPNGQGFALRETVNKTTDSTTTPNAAVNLYPTNVFLSGNFAVRFSMNVNQGNVGGIEGPLFGINCNGVETNWWTGLGISGVDWQWGADGIWAWIANGQLNTFISGPGDYVVLTGNKGKLPNTGWGYPAIAQVDASAFANQFKTNMFTSSGGPGLPANGSPDNFASIQYWADVEIKQFNNVITFSIDKTPICVYTNTTSFTNGYIMLGDQQPFGGYNGEDSAVYYSGLQVVQLTPPAISGSESNAPGTYTFDFTSPDGTATASSFSVVGTPSLTSPTWTPVSATISQTPDGVYHATVQLGSGNMFFRIQQQL